MKQKIAVLVLVVAALPAFAVTSRELEDACYAKIKPLIKDKTTKVTGVKTTPPESARRNSAWHVTFDFNRKLINDNDSARCMFKTDGSLWSDDYSKHLEALDRAKQMNEAAKKADDEKKQKAGRYN